MALSETHIFFKKVILFAYENWTIVLCSLQIRFKVNIKKNINVIIDLKKS